MSSTKSPPGIKLKTYMMSGFSGLDSSTDITGQDTGERQPLATCDNASCDWRGQIVRDPAAKRVLDGSLITHVRFYGDNEDETNVVYAEQSDYAVSLKSDRDHILEDVYEGKRIVTSTVFANAVHLCSGGGYMYRYNGSTFTRNESNSMEYLSPAYCCAVQRRLVVAGLLGRKTEVHLARVDTHNVFPDDEDPNEENVLRAGKIDVGNLIGTADQVRGIAAFEQNRLAIFTRNKTLIYVIDPDINNWELDERANINIGTISHNTIQQAGTDLLFCSERGVHTIRRSRENGILVYADVLSRKVDMLYRSMLKSVPDKQSVSALWNQETGQYTIYFPQSDRLVKSLTLTLTSGDLTEGSWSTGSYVNARCGDMLGGRAVVAGYGGVYELMDVEDDDDNLVDVPMEIMTPVSWHGSMTQDKQSHSFFIHASGQGDLLVEVFNERNQLLAAYPLEIEDDDDGQFPDNPISRQYERKFEARYRGLRTRITSTGKGLVRILAFGFNVRA